MSKIMCDMNVSPKIAKWEEPPAMDAGAPQQHPWAVRAQWLARFQARAGYVFRRVRPIRVLYPGLRGTHTGRLHQLVRRKACRCGFAPYTLWISYVSLCLG